MSKKLSSESEEESRVENMSRPTLEKRANGESPPRPLFHSRRLALLATFVALVLVAAYFTYRYYAVRETTDDAQIDGHVNPIAARVGGTVIAVNIEENQTVKEGDVLVQLDPKDYRVALERTQADLQEAEATAKAAGKEVPVTSTTTTNQVSSAEAGVARAESGTVVAAKEIETARARLALTEARAREAQANYLKASQDLDRLKQLIVKDEISRQEFDAAVAAADSAHAARDSAQAAVEEAEKGVEAAEAKFAQSRQMVAEAQAGLATAKTAPEQTAITRDRAVSALARVAIARAVVDQARLNLQYTTVSAPVSGVISMKNVEVGQTVQAGQPLLAVVPLGDIWVKANYKETQLKNMHAGQAALISVDAYGGRRYQGYVESISAATGGRFSLLPPENATGNYVKVVQRVPVRIRFERGQDPQHLLRPGMSVEPTVITK